MKSLLCVALAVILAFGLAGGIAVGLAGGHAHAAGPGHACDRGCGNGAPHGSPCGGRGAPADSSCPFCALCTICCATVVPPDTISVFLLSSRLAALPGWNAPRRTYPPPFPPPRIEAS